MILRPLDDLWTVRLPPGTVGAAVPTSVCGCYGGSWRLGARPGQNRSIAGRLRNRACKFNTGVVLLRPNMTIFRRLEAALATSFARSMGKSGAFKCTDGFQTMWSWLLWKDVACLPRTFNCYQIMAAHRRSPAKECLLPSEVDENRTHPHVFHFAGQGFKPWTTASEQSPDHNVTADLWGWTTWGEQAAAAEVTIL